ncbi:hypothetical protein Q1M64_25255 [Sinorhizobium meliloti]|nr:hypothetical protein Q1M64_25255 [Sinorhizobium meliloti]
MRLLALAAILIAVLLLFLLISGFADVPLSGRHLGPEQIYLRTYRG